MKRGMLVLGILVVLVGVTLLSAVFIVREDQQAVVLQFGDPKETYRDATYYFKIPFIQNVVYFDKRVLDFDASKAEVPTLDQKQLVVDAFARYRITNPLEFYKTVNNESVAQGQLNNIINANLREVFGKASLARLLTAERSKLMLEITKLVDEGSRHLGIQVVDVRIKHVDLPEENSKAIFRRMQTQREQEARRIRAEGDRDARRIRADADKTQRVIIAEARKTSEITRGTGDAKATELYNNAYGRDRGFFDFYRSLQAMRTGLDGKTTSYVGPPKGEFYRFFDNDGDGKVKRK